MTGRLVLTLAAVAAGPAAFAQVRDEETPLPGPVNTRPVVTLGSAALTATPGPCKAVSFSADGRAVYVLSHSAWRRHDLATGRDVGHVAGSGGGNDVLYPRADGDTVLCLHRDQERAGKVRVLDLRTGHEVRSLAANPSDTLVPSDDGACVGVAGARSARVVWLDGKGAEVVADGVADLRRLAKASGADILAFLGDDRVAVHSPAGLWKLDLPKATAYTSVALTADGAVLATASAVETDDGKRPGPIDLWDVPGRKKLRTVEAVDWFAEAPHRLRFTPDGKTLVAGDGAYLRGWNAATGAKTFAVEPGWGWVGNLQISPDGRHVAVAYASRPMVYDLATGRQPPGLVGHAAAVWDVACSPDGRRAATAMFGRPTVYVWETATGKNLGEFHASFPPPAGGGRVVPGRVRVQFSPDGAYLLTTNESSGGGSPVRVWDAATFGLVRAFPVPAGDDATAAFTRHGVFALLARKPTLLDPATGREVGTAAGEPVGFTLDGRGLMLEGGKRTLRYRDLAAGDDRVVRDGAAAPATAFSETGLAAAPVAAYNLPPECHVLSARDGRPVSVCAGSHTSTFGGTEPPAVVFSRDGRTLAVVSGRDGQVRCFETYSGQELFRCALGHQLRTAAFTPDGRTFLIAGGDEDTATQVVGWDATGGAWDAAPVVPADGVGKLTAAFAAGPAAARKALYHLAARPADAVAFAREVTTLATAADYANYDRWLADLDAPAFATREAATKGLAKGGWRAEAQMRQALAKTESAEVRDRLEGLLARRDVRPLRAVHLLEVVGTPEAVAVLTAIAAGPAESLVVQDARWALLRLEGRANP